MIDTPEIAERRNDLEIAIAAYAETFIVYGDDVNGPKQTCAWSIMKLRVDLLMVAVEHAARVAQIGEDYEKMREHLK